MAKISDLAKITSPNDGNVLPISDGLTTKKISFLDLKTSINTVASGTQLGTIKIGTGLSIDNTGTVSVLNFDAFTLAPATQNQLGGVIIGEGLTVNEAGVLTSAYTLPIATPTVLGGIKVGEGLTISNGILSTIPISVEAFDDSGITIGNQNDFLFYVEDSNTPTIKDDVNGVIVLSVRDTSMAGNLADIRLISRANTVGLGDETAPALVPDFSGQPMNLGTPSLRWSKVYASNFIGNVTGTATKSTEADSLLVGLDYLSASTSPVTDTIVARDSIGNINANNFIGNVTGNVTGNSSTATQLQTSRTINGEPFNGTQNITITAANPQALTRGNYITGGSSAYNGNEASTWSVNATSSATPNTVVARDSNGDFQATSVVATNFVGNVTGNVTGNVIGNADTASRLNTARKINGVNFDGTQDIQLPASAAKVDELAGSIKMWGSATPPTNWLLCNGQSVSKLFYPTLFSRIGYNYGGSGDFFNLPNLINKFPVGAGGLYSANSTGGSKDQIVIAHQHTATAQSLFTGNVLPNHSHTFSGNSLPAHSHAYSDPGHAHYVLESGNDNGDSASYIDSANSNNPQPTILQTQRSTVGINIISTSAGTPSGTINSSSSGVPSGSVNTTVAISTEGASGTNANLPPYIGVYYIIKASDDGSGGGTLQAGTGIDIQTSGSYSIISSTVNTSTFLPTTGGTMSGFLTLNGNPSSANHAANKAYVDTKFNSVTTIDNTKLPLTGGSLSGSLFLHAKPTSALQAATKNYVDDRISFLANSEVRQVKTKTIGYGRPEWNGGINNWDQGGSNARAYQLINSTVPVAVQAPFGNFLQVTISPYSLDSRFMVNVDVASAATYVSYWAIRKSINGGPFVATVNTMLVTAGNPQGYGTFGPGLQNVNFTYFPVNDGNSYHQQRVNFNYIDPVAPNVGETITYRLYACSFWANVARNLGINNRSTVVDMPNYSNMIVTEFRP
jgi:microcystin-dependent protein